MYYYQSQQNLISTYNKKVPKRNLNYTLIYELEYYIILDLLYSCHNKKLGWTFEIANMEFGI
jgi:hypothetical protein